MNEQIMTRPVHSAVDVAIKMAIVNANNPGTLSVPYLLSAPGCGKTEILKSEAKKRGFGFLSKHLAYILIEELTGLPEFHNIDDDIKGTKWTLPELISEVYSLSKQYPFVILLLDDFHLCNIDIANLGYELFCNHAIKGYKLPNNVGIILAGNNSAKANAKTLSSGIVNRCCLLPVHADYERWKHEYAIPNNLYRPGIKFLDYEIHRKYFHGEEQVNEPWPSPRQWSHLLRLLQMLKDANTLTESDVLYYGINHIGLAGQEFASWHNIFSKVDVKAAFQGNFEVPHEIIEVYTFMSACTLEFIERIQSPHGDNDKIYEQFNNILRRVGETSAEMVISAFKTIVDFEKSSKKKMFTKLLSLIKNTNRSLYDNINKAIINL